MHQHVRAERFDQIDLGLEARLVIATVNGEMSGSKPTMTDRPVWRASAGR